MSKLSPDAKIPVASKTETADETPHKKKRHKK
jgi:hypothetical protein